MIVLDPKLLFCSDRFSSFCRVTQKGVTCVLDVVSCQ